MLCMILMSARGVFDLHDDYWVYDEDKEEYVVREVDTSVCQYYYSDDDCKECSHRWHCGYYRS